MKPRPTLRSLTTAVCILAGSISLQGAPTAWRAAGPDFNWSTAGNWTNGVPTDTSSVYFTTNSGDSPNNIVDSDTTIQSLWLQNTNPASFDMLINPGKKLRIVNSLSGSSVYPLNAGGTFTLSQQITSTIRGPDASLEVVSTNGIFNVKESMVGSSGAPWHTLNMSELDTFTGYLGRLYVAGDGAGYRGSGTLYLPKTNLVVLHYSSGPQVLLGNLGNGAPGGTLYLGMTNAFFGNIGTWIGFRRANNCTLAFADSATGGTALFHGLYGTNRQSYFNVGDASTQDYNGNSVNGTADFSLGTVDILATSLVVGRGNKSLATVATNLAVAGTTGTLTFSSGTIDVNTATIGYQMLDRCAQVQGTVNVDGTGKLVVNNSMQLGRFMKAWPENGTSKAILNIGTKTGGGAVIVNGPIITSTSDESANQSEINLRATDSTLYAKNSVGPLLYLELTSGTMTIELDGNPAAPVCICSNLLTGAGFKLNLQATGLEPGHYTLIDYETLYSGNGMDDLVFSMPAYLQGFLSNNLANSSIDLVITNNNLITVWNGDKSDNWDISLTANWKSPTTGASRVYSQASIPGDIALFNDTATGSGNVVITTDVAPSDLIVSNATKAYVFSGPGGLKGPTPLAKSGVAALTIGNDGANDFTGGVVINGGTLKLAGHANCLPVDSAITLADAVGAVLDLNSQDQTVGSLNGGGATGGNISLGSGTLTVTAGGNFGAAISGAGKLVTSGPGTLVLSGANTYAGGTAIETNATITVANTSGSAVGTGAVDIKTGGTLRIGNGSSQGAVGSAVLSNNGSIVFNTSNSITFANLISGSGSISKENANTVLTLGSANDFTGPTYINAGAILVTHPQGLGSSTSPDSAFSTRISSTPGAHLELGNNVTLDEAIIFACKTGTLLTQPGILSVSGTNTLNGPIILDSGGSVHNFSAAAGSKLIVNGTFLPSDFWVGGYPYHCVGGDGDGEIISGFINGSSYSGMTNNLYKTGNGTWTLSGSNAYAGFTVVSNGTLVVNGSILGTNPGPMPANFYIGCAVRAAGTLKGDGLIQCVVTNAGTFSPGSTIGTMKIKNVLTMLPGSTNLFEIGPSAYDKVQELTSVLYGGVLKVVLTRSLSGGEIFKLFSAQDYSQAGSFDTYDLPVLSEGLGWDTTQLATDGTLRVTGGTPKVEFGQSLILADGNFQMSGTATATGTYRVMASTNLVDASSWTQIGAGTFDAGAFSFTDLNATNQAKRFYRIVAP